MQPSTHSLLWELGRGVRCVHGCRSFWRWAVRAGQGGELPARGFRLHVASAGKRRRLHRLLCRHSPCQQCRQAVPSRQPVAAELQVRAHRLSRPSVVDPPVRNACAPAEGAGEVADAPMPSFGPSQRLDYELELGIWIGPGNALGEPIPITEAAEHVAGCLLNDWSARDIQAWEYQPLGPFLSKNFASTISAWIVTPEALAPFRIAQPADRRGRSRPLPYLLDEADQRGGGLDLELEVLLLTPGLREKGLPPHRLALSNTKNMYWTVAQMVTHHL